MNIIITTMNYPVSALFISALLLISPQSLFAAEVGAPAPVCSLSEIGGDTPIYDTSQFRGKVVYLDFWASWCVPCAKSFPFMNQLHNDLKDKGLQLIGVNLDENPADAKAFLEKYTVGFTLTADRNGQCASKFEVKGMPTSYLIGQDGTVRHVHQGFRSGETKELYQLVEQLLAEKPASSK
ncbi:MAG: TlpA family protein disulfide reductase [Methylosarcina sp.]